MRCLVGAFYTLFPEGEAQRIDRMAGPLCMAISQLKTSEPPPEDALMIFTFASGVWYFDKPRILYATDHCVVGAMALRVTVRCMEHVTSPTKRMVFIATRVLRYDTDVGVVLGEKIDMCTLTIKKGRVRIETERKSNGLVSPVFDAGRVIEMVSSMSKQLVVQWNEKS